MTLSCVSLEGAAQDLLLLLEHRQEAIKLCNRERRTYNKRNAVHWEDGITETQKKQMRACFRELPANHNETEVPENNLIEDEYKRMTIHQLGQEIKLKRITAPRNARMRKCQLIELLNKNQ